MSTGFTPRHLRYLLQDYAELFSVTPDPDLFRPTSPIGSVVVLSAPPTITPTEHIEANQENTARIRHGIDLVLTSSSPRQPVLYLNGEVQQLWAMNMLVRLSGVGVRDESIKSINCGNRGIANTLTQFQAIKADQVLCETLKAAGVTAFVTSLYHVPRVRRTARHVIGDLFPWVVVSVPMSACSFDLQLIPREIGKIITYVEKGDLSPEP